MNFDVIMPAGGRINGAFAAETGVEVKALLPIGETTMLEHTLHELRASHQIGRCVVIGPDILKHHPSIDFADAVIPEGDTGPDNIFRGIDWLKTANNGRHADRVMIVTTDLPFVTSEIIADFIEACPSNADICAPIIKRDEFSSKFPDSPIEYVRLNDGEWTMGCAFLINPVALEANRRHIDDIFAVRKSQLGMVRMLGLSFIARFLTRRLSVPHIQRRCSEIVGCSVCGVMNCAPELAFDIDSQDEYRYAIECSGILDRSKKINNEHIS